MTAFPRSPKFLKGAIVGIDIFNPLASVIVFQYNPDGMNRTLQARAAKSEGNTTAEPMRLEGAPKETITIDVEIDATDQLEAADGVTVAAGIYPQLSALEMLLYPKSALVIANTILSMTGGKVILPPTAPFTLFIWGAKRVLPVRLTGFSIHEEAYDTSLNPIRAKVSMSLTVLSYNDFTVSHPGYYVFLAHQVVKEAMAVVGSVGNIAGAAATAAGAATSTVSGTASVSASASFNLG